MKKMFLLLIVLMFVAVSAKAQNININNKFIASYEVTSGAFPNLSITYDTVSTYILLRVCSKRNSNSVCGFLNLNSQSYDRANGDVFYFDSAEACRLEVFVSDSPFTEIPDTPNYDSGWISF